MAQKPKGEKSMNLPSQPDNLIPVIDGEIGGEVQPCVDARTLHLWLKSGDRFADWIKKRIKTYGFIENEDFACFSVITETQRNDGRKGKAKQLDYLLTLDVAKELSMVENNLQGRMARRYFINCEKVLRKTVFGLMDQFNKASIEFDKFSEIASQAGRTLSLVGKQYKPKAKQKLDDLKIMVQPHLTGLELKQ
ncbi:antA/AntB antirepressor family protein [Acinetobacter sp. C32I]|uniref:antA/AntB antirepressor family protein n=1 Tax=Acinetobacter sp. C32I TaxID=2950074 RepID=UPI0020375ABB|nr:antA/AntB antirepressor family protein [Acinetobacter sp. C32I]USA54579.1 antA/AntB antirepressor family protein [Acinetobacter sp. C32I]